ncbi:AsmA family protein [Thiomicrospira microaerophila]|uniref:AsmA family protein n=1 Tax=Thiomicrospira microaerophila TaxID=406020 RepID=UPI00200E9391|nr:AsmA family protein [Thiomicrospira microaerophila]UQB42367.1 AsmA family protein [Thiomicrospira microaerophila]
MASLVKRLVKILLIVAISVPLFVLIGFVLAISFMDFNKYKPMIEQEISNKTGLDLTISGDLKAGVWPLQLTIENTQVSSPSADPEAEPLLRFDKLNLQASYADLFLRRQIQLTAIEWFQPRLVVTRQLDGQLSWQKQAALEADWQYRRVVQTQEEAALVNAILTPLAKLVKEYDLKLKRFSLYQGELIWRDLINDQALDISALNFEALPIQLTEPIAIKLEAEVKNLHTQQNWRLNYQANLRLSDSLDQIQLYDLQGSNWIEWPQQSARAPLELSVTLKQLSGVFSENDWQWQGLALSSEHLAFEMDLALQGRDQDQAYQTQLRIKQANLRYWFDHWDWSYPNFINEQAFTQLSGELDAQWANQAWSLDRIALNLDQTQIMGQFAYRFTEQAPIYQFDLNLDHLNLDFYAAKASEPRLAADTQPPQEVATYLPLAVPVSTLRESKIQGRLAIGDLQAWQTQVQKVTIGIDSNYGQMSLAPFDAQLYGGEWLSQLQVDVNQDTPKYKLKGRMNQVDAQAFLLDLLSYDQLSGQLHSRFDLTTQGSNLDAIKYHLNGLFSAEIKDGVYRGLDVNKLLAGRVSVEGDVTELDQLVLRGEAINGIYHIQQAELDSARFSARAFGRVHIPLAQIDSRLQLTYQQPPEALAKLKGMQVPIKLTGPLREPKWQVELSQLLSPDNAQRLLNLFR